MGTCGSDRAMWSWDVVALALGSERIVWRLCEGREKIDRVKVSRNQNLSMVIFLTTCQRNSSTTPDPSEERTTERKI